MPSPTSALQNRRKSTTTGSLGLSVSRKLPAVLAWEIPVLSYQEFFGITTIAGYQFSRNIKAGAGIGVQVHNGGTLFPLFLDFRLNLNSQEIVPFFSGAGGVLLNFNDLIDETRVFINPMAGVRFVAANRTAISFSTGLMVSTGGPAERKSYLNFKLGVEMKFRN